MQEIIAIISLQYRQTLSRNWSEGKKTIRSLSANKKRLSPDDTR